MHTYLVYVGKLNPYRDPIHVNVKALAPRKATVFQAASSGSGHPIAPQVGVGAVPSSADLSAPLQARSESDPASHGHTSIREPSPRELASIHRPPPVLLDGRGTFCSMWRGFSKTVVGTVKISIWWSGVDILSHTTRGSLRCPSGRTVRTPWTF